MITSSTFYPFGGKVSTVETPSFNLCISTAKAGLFKKQSVEFFVYTTSLHNRRTVAKLEYNGILDKSARLGMHDPITHTLDEFGMNGMMLREALESLFSGLREKGIGVGMIIGYV